MPPCLVFHAFPASPGSRCLTARSWPSRPEGWLPCGVGDWAVALRSPVGSVVARVCPFDPAYWVSADLCRERAGNRWLPRIELTNGLEGGGSVVFLEFVAPVDHAVARQFAGQWRTGPDALRTGHPVYRPEEHHRRDPRPPSGLGTRCRMTARGSAREQPPMLQTAPEHQICRPSQPTSWQRNLRQLGRADLARRPQPAISDRHAARLVLRSASDLAEYAALASYFLQAVTGPRLSGSLRGPLPGVVLARRGPPARFLSSSPGGGRAAGVVPGVRAAVRSWRVAEGWQGKPITPEGAQPGSCQEAAFPSPATRLRRCHRASA